MAKFFGDSVRGQKCESESASPVNLGVTCLLFYKEKLYLIRSFIHLFIQEVNVKS